MRQTAVCIIVENLPVPLDRRVWREACALRDAGYRVSIICPAGTGPLSVRFEIREGIEVYRHRTWEASTLLGYILEYGWAMSAELFLTLKLFLHTRFRILQACNPPDTIFLIALIFKAFGVRFIFDQHDLSPELFEAKFGTRARILYRLVRLAEFCSYHLADVCIATNQSFKETAIARGGKRPEDVFVVRNCPSLRFFHSGVPPSRKFGKPLLVTYVGFMGTQDGLDLLLQSIEQLVIHQRRQDTHFLLVGGGSILPDLRTRIVLKGLDSYVTLAGQVSHDEVATYLSMSDIGVAPDPKNDMNDKSTMIKIFEYMAFGLPVVLFDLTEGRRVAGPAALYATPNDPTDFAKKIKALLDSSELRQQLGDSGRRRIREVLNWEKEQASLLNAYGAALKSGLQRKPDTEVTVRSLPRGKGLCNKRG